VKNKANIGKIIAFWAGPLAGLSILFFMDLNPEKHSTTAMLSVAAWMAIWWITEVIPLAATSLLPVVLFPILGIMDGKAVSSIYFNHIIFLFIGGFIVAMAMQKWNLHRRIALKTLLIIGTGRARILLGFMLATAFLSMWISNTATTMMMVPILISVLSEIEGQKKKKKRNNFSTALLLGVAYSASIGGMMTLVGTPPNLSFTRIYQIMFPDAPEISFAQWLIFAVPAGVALFLFAWGYLLLVYKDKNASISIENRTLREEYAKLGKMSREEIIILIDFVLLAVLWVSRSDLALGKIVIPGWSNIFGNPEYINDGTVAIGMALILFFIPSKENRKVRLMNWETAKGLPWGIVILFGGGFALAGGFKESGLSIWMGEQLSFVAGFHPILIVGIIAFSMTFLTELTSNTATTEMILPILAGLAVASDIHPLLLMLPATMSASMAFMLPVATPPNAIVFGTNRLKIKEMARTGLIMNLAGTIVITLAVYFLASKVFGFEI
jgi:sodium-dependent dicarboxylate transporter 2/3/5